ncbi:hypothetical protein D3C78_1560980 [compost metagenome]
MPPKRLPSTWRALGSRVATLWRSAGMPLEPPVKNSVSTCAAPTPASASSWPMLALMRSSCAAMASSNSARLSSALSPASMRLKSMWRLSCPVRAILLSSTSIASQWPARCSIRRSMRSMPVGSAMS